jgi:hypothetical protein
MEDGWDPVLPWRMVSAEDDGCGVDAITYADNFALGWSPGDGGYGYGRELVIDRCEFGVVGRQQ